MRILGRFVVVDTSGVNLVLNLEGRDPGLRNLLTTFFSPLQTLLLFQASFQTTFFSDLHVN